jgi:predicted O-linked N-acetylglucosamine transferase (SPINDLY family)
VPTIAETLAQAKAYHGAGQLSEALQLYERVVQADSAHAEAHYLRGAACHGLGRANEAIASLAQALRLRPDDADTHNYLGVVLTEQGALDEAILSFQRALLLRPGSSEISKNIQNVVAAKDNNLGNALAAQGKLDEAAACYRRALERNPDYLDAHAQLGAVLSGQGRLDEAENCYRRIVELKPDSAEANYNLAVMAGGQNKLDAAANSYRRALELKPDFAEAHHRLGAVLEKQGRLSEAADCWRRARELKPDDVDAHAHLAAVLAKQGRFGEAEDCYRRIVELKPDAAGAHNNLAVVLSRQGQFDEAENCLRRALDLKPDDTEAFNNLGFVLSKERQFDEAERCLRRALELKPDYTEAFNNLGNALRGQGQLSAAIDAYGRALQLDPGYAAAHGNLANALADCGWTEDALLEFERALEIVPDDAGVIANYGVCLQSQGRLDEAIESYRKAVCLDAESPGYHGNLVYALNFHPDFDAETVFAEHRVWAGRHADPLLLGSAPHANDRTPGRRLRVGYVSAHFQHHAVNFFSEPILAAHDHRAIEVFCYSAAVPAESDATTRRLQDYADHWREIAGQSDQQVSETIRADQIDILVDLTGHIGGNRLLVFARKPAPVQVTYIGYQNTTGMLAMDYRLTDAWADPPGATDHLYTEKLVRLPRAFFCYLPPALAPDVSPLPAIANGLVTFGSFNNPAKITPRVLETWAGILSAVPNSRLVLLARVTAGFRQHVGRAFERQGVSADRVELVERRPLGEYLQLIECVDIGLDPFPFNGHTTTCDCLWMGVPVVMLAGHSYASRFGGSALVNLGLRDLIAGSREDYVEIASGLAADLDRLKGLRAGLRVRMSDSPLVDAQGFTRNLEAVYRRMWADWCAKQSA